MPDTTPIFDWPVPVLGDDPNGPAQITALADAIETSVASLATAPSGDASNSQILISADKRLTGSARTDILTATFTTTRNQTIWVAAKVRIDNSGAAEGDVGISIIADGNVIDLAQAGPISIPQPNSGTPDLSIPRVQITIPFCKFSTSAGSHTVKLQADRNGTGQLDAIAHGVINSRDYYPTTLTVIV